MSKPNNSSKFVTLDGLRGFAALAVMIFHFQDHSKLMDGWAPFKAGWLAVDFFFVLSGFVIAHAYDRRFAAGMTMRQFMVARLVRLAPMYLFGTALTILYLAVLRFKHYYLHQDPLATFYTDSVLGLFAIPQFLISQPFYPLNFPAWSLIFELIANIAYRFLFTTLSTRTLIGIVAISYLATYIPFRTFGASTGVGYAAPDLVRVSYGFFVGVLIYRIWSRSTFRPNVPAWSLIIALLVLLVSKKYEHYAVALFPILVYLGASAGSARLTDRCFIALGELSFGIYMIQDAIIRIAVTTIDRFPEASAANAGYLAAFATGLGAIFLAFVSYHAYDVPVRSWMLRRLPQKPSSRPRIEDRLAQRAAEPIAGGHP